MATKVNYQRDLGTSAAQFDSGAYVSAGNAIGQAEVSAAKADAGLLSYMGGQAVEAVKAYEAADLAKKLRTETDKLFKETSEIVQARDELSVSQLNLKGLEATKGTVFDADQAQQISAAEAAVLDKRKRLEAALEQGKITPDKALRNMAVEVRAAIAKWPGFADKFRKIASEMTGVDNLETYELRQIYAQDTARKAQEAAAAAKVRELAEKEAVKLHPLVAAATGGKASLQDVTQLVLSNDPSIAPFRSTWAAREEADNILKKLKSDSSITSELKGDAPIAQYTTSAIKLGNEVSAMFLARVKNDASLAGMVDPKGTLNPDAFSRLLASKNSHVLQMQTSFRTAFENSYQEAKAAIERLPISASDKNTARDRLETAHERSLKSLERSDGLAQIYNTFITSANEGSQAQARTLSMLNNAAEMMGITSDFWKMRQSNPEGFKSQFPAIDATMGRLEKASTLLVNLVGETNGIIGHIEKTGEAPVLSKPLTKEQAEFIKSVTVDGRRNTFNRAATDPAWAKQNPEQVTGALNMLLEGGMSSSLDPTSQKFTDFLKDVSTPQFHHTLGLLPAAEKEYFTGRVVNHLTKVGQAKAEAVSELSNFVPKIWWSTPDGKRELKEWFKPVLEPDQGGRLSVRWEMLNAPPVADPARAAGPYRPLQQLAPFVKRGDQWIPNPEGIVDAELSAYVKTVNKTVADLNRLAVAASNTKSLTQDSSKEWIGKVLKNLETKAGETSASSSEKRMATEVSNIDESGPKNTFQDAVQGLMRDLNDGKLSAEQQKEVLRMLKELGYGVQAK